MNAIDQVKRVNAGEMQVETRVRALLERIDDVDQDIDAWAYLDRDAALAQARALDNGPALPLRGLVFAAKDNIDTHDMPTGYGSRVHHGKMPPRDAACIASLRLKGALLLGKTISTEFAHVFPGATRNPHNKDHTPGGSSSGSAAAVASGMVDMALGTQTTGSVIRPAAYCGTVGYKPTYGEINLSGVLANSPSFDTIGMMTHSVEDIGLLHGHWLQIPDENLIAPAIESLRVGVFRTPYWDDADADAQATLEQAAIDLSRVGASVSDFDDLGALTDLPAISQRVSGFEFAQTMAHERLYALDDLSDDLRDGRMRTGFETGHSQYVADKQQLERARVIMDTAFDNIDVVICLPAPGAAPVGLRRTGSPIFNMPWTSLHAPAITLPLFTADNGLPMGLQICSKRYNDRQLMSSALAIQHSLDNP